MSDPIAETAVSLPAPALRPFISQYAGFRFSGLPPGVHVGLPSTDVELIFSLGRPIDVLRMPNSSQQPSAFTALVGGLQDAPVHVRQTGEAFGLHVFIKPYGVRPILGVAGADIASLVLNLSDVWPNGAGDLTEMLLGADSWQQRFAVLDQAFVCKLNPTSPPPDIHWAWQRLANSHGSVPVHVLADEIGYSRRHFGDRFRETIGVTPKLAARLFRFERACCLISEQKGCLADVAIASGYYDQPHLTREWHALAGCSPAAWIARELPFLQDYELGGRDNGSDGPESVRQSFV
jgi:AraC-like DNA-binding protein